ncbi:MAG: hypothetical protein HYZ51_03345 [Candidatus Doudnabacteria bacterium]|nr:hypothetical protein [Candidatus Doudnabacteria bacterium]
MDWSIEPRLNQVFVPLLSIIHDQDTIDQLKEVAQEYHRQFISDKGMEVEAQLLEVMVEVLQRQKVLFIKEIASHFAEKYGAEYERKITPKWVGSLIRRKLHLRTERRKEGHMIAFGEYPKISRLLERYGVQVEPVQGESPGEEGVAEGTPILV